MPIPEFFCWTRYGTEAGQSIEQILERKEEERTANDGLFFWGVGNAVGPSIRELVRHKTRPEVLFSPIKCAPRKQDVVPSQVVAWTTGETLEDDQFRLPNTALITSRLDPVSPRLTHYALVCFSASPLGMMPSGDKLALGHLRNLLTGRPIGASQVTAIVNHDASTAPGPATYDVTLRVHLAPPFFLRLRNPKPLAGVQGIDWGAAVRSAWRCRVADPTVV